MEELLCQYVADANEALELKLVRKKEDLQDVRSSFRPEMSHQVFGESEKIFGYKGVKVQLYYTAASLQTYLGIKYSEKLNLKDFSGVQADNIEETVSDKLAPGFTTSINEFMLRIEKDVDFRPYGELKSVFQIKGKDSSEQQRTFEVYHCDVTTPGFLPFHERLQTFLLWYVDAASFIDTDDDHWTFFMVYEKYKTSEGDTRYATVGYATVYRYYAYPMHIRPRISQVLVLPPFQRMGICSNLLQTLYNHFTMPEVLDITIEDPSEEFQRIRDFVDAKNLQHLPSFHPDKLKQGFSKEMASQAQAKHRVYKKQARRVYEILRLKNTNRNDPVEYKAYRLDVKNRLNAPFQNKKKNLKKLRKALTPNELIAAQNSVEIQETQKRLHTGYLSLEEDYNVIIKRLELGY